MPKLVNLGCGVVLRDVTDKLPSDRNPTRSAKDVKYLFVHHSGAEGAPGFSGLENSVKYVTEKRGFAGPAYTFWIPRVMELDADLNTVIYRCMPDTHIGAHTRRVNYVGSAVCLQGNMQEKPPTAAQYHALEMLIRHLVLDTYSLCQRVLPHSRANEVGGHAKGACPGPDLELYCKTWEDLT